MTRKKSPSAKPLRALDITGVPVKCYEQTPYACCSLTSIITFVARARLFATRTRLFAARTWLVVGIVFVTLAACFHMLLMGAALRSLRAGLFARAAA